MKLNFGLLIAVQAGRDFKKNGKPKHNQKENRVLRQSDSFASTNVKQNLKFGWMLENVSLLLFLRMKRQLLTLFWSKRNIFRSL